MQSVCYPPLTAPSLTLSHPQNVGEKSPDTRADATFGAVVAVGEHGHGRGSATGVCTHIWWTLTAAQAAQEAAEFATSIESGREGPTMATQWRPTGFLSPDLHCSVPPSGRPRYTGGASHRRVDTGSPPRAKRRSLLASRLPSWSPLVPTTYVWAKSTKASGGINA